jgi:hypothetical protein
MCFLGHRLPTALTRPRALRRMLNGIFWVP